jgi:hypothetical protein
MINNLKLKNILNETPLWDWQMNKSYMNTTSNKNYFSAHKWTQPQIKSYIHCYHLVTCFASNSFEKEKKNKINVNICLKC